VNYGLAVGTLVAQARVSPLAKMGGLAVLNDREVAT
jgi:hypothetical protein